MTLMPEYGNPSASIGNQNMTSVGSDIKDPEEGQAFILKRIFRGSRLVRYAASSM